MGYHGLAVLITMGIIALTLFPIALIISGIILKEQDNDTPEEQVGRTTRPETQRHENAQTTATGKDRGQASG